MERRHYVRVPAACLAGAAPLEFVGKGVHRRPRRTLTAIGPVAAICVAESGMFRAGLFPRAERRMCSAIVSALHIPVDGWGVHGGTPTVVYNYAHITGIRAPLHIPIEGFRFGFAPVRLVLLMREQSRRRESGQR